MNRIEVVGGLKQELKLIKGEYEEESEVVEIGFDDILGLKSGIFEGVEGLGYKNFVLNKDTVKNESDISTEDESEDSINGSVNNEDTNDESEKENEKNEILFMNFEKQVENSPTNKKETLKPHNRENVKINQCPHCPFKSKNNITYHILCFHTDSDQIEWLYCDRCNYKCKLKTQLVRHNASLHLGQMKKCDRCEKEFKTADALVRHVRSVHEQIRFNCEICDYSMLYKHQLTEHKKEYHSDPSDLRDLKCLICSFTTKFRNKYKAHMIQHKDNMWQCHICAYKSKHKHHLDLHLISHQKKVKEEDLKYKCSECSYKTYRPYNLTIHEMKHKKPKDIQYFECFHCGFKANRKDNLKAHIARHDKKNDILFQCFICDFQTKSRPILIDHIDKHSKNGKKYVK